MPGTHSQGTGIGAGERWTKANYGHSCYVAHPKERQSVHNNAVYFEVEILHCLNVQACPELVKAEEKRDKHLNKFYRWLPFLPTKKTLKPWGMEVEEGEGRFSPWEDGVTPSQLWKMNHVFSIESLQIFWETCHWGYNRDDCPFWRLSIFWREQCTSIGGSNEKLKWKLKVCETAFVGCVHLFMWDQHSQPSRKRKCQIWLQKY